MVVSSISYDGGYSVHLETAIQEEAVTARTDKTLLAAAVICKISGLQIFPLVISLGVLNRVAFLQVVVIAGARGETEVTFPGEMVAERWKSLDVRLGPLAYR